MHKFIDVFNKLNMDENLRKLFSDVDVEKITAPSDYSYLVIYIISGHIIDRASIRKMERLIKTSLYPSKKIRIHIKESFRLSAQYNAKNLYDIYKDTILEDVREHDVIEYAILQKSDIYFESDDTMELSIPDDITYRSVADDLAKFLEYEIYKNRCHIDVNIKLKFVEYVDSLPNKDTYTPKTVEKANKEDKYIGDVSDKSKEKKEKDVVLDPGKDSKAKRNAKSGYVKKPANPDVLYGRDFEDNFIRLKDIEGNVGEITVRAYIFSLDERLLRSGKTLFIFNITDFTDSITVKLFADEGKEELVRSAIKKGSYIKLHGMTTIDKFDGELTVGSVLGIKKCESFHELSRVDTAAEKRVELHCHTKMSDLDAVSSASDIIKRAAKWGWDSIAITDHGNVQAFPEAFHTVRDMKEGAPKIIYGVEGYLVDDIKEIIINPSEYTLDDSYVVFDIETTGFSPINDKIIEIGAVKVSGGKIVDRYSTFVNPKIPIPYRIQELTHIDDSMVIDSPTIDTILPEFLSFCEGSVIVAHNASFDTSFIREAAKKINLSYNPAIVDTVAMARLLLPRLNRFKLDTVAKALGISLDNHHRAVDDAECTAQIWLKLIDMLKEQGISTLKEISSMAETNEELIKKLPTYHVIILIQNEIGRVNLYRLISYSNIKYYNRKPRIPKSELSKYREGLIIGSACSAGELYEAVLRGESDAELQRIVDFYDYLEIQPIGNNNYMLDSDKFSVSTAEDLQDINKRLVELGDKNDKLVCATGDVHFLDPEDEIYRRIIQASNGYDDADIQPPLYLKTTDEMLDEFSYLGQKKAYEVVVTNTRKVSDMIEYVEPVRPDKCPPVIENSDNDLRDACYKKAHEQYGDKLPKIVEDRLERELNSIITNGFAVMYIIAKKLVDKSIADGYLVGSRGSVGSSFAAYTSGITEVNPLPPHYYCPSCKYSDFDSDEVKEYAGMAGCDMPDKLCPVCGKPLKKDGFDIPFETFLGFKGDKEPDIDLNFSGEEQSVAHAYTEVIFGKGQTYRAGTIGGLADKTAYGYVKKYFEEHGERKRKCEIDRIVQGCVGVKRTTGQHPGGIVVVPHGEEIYSFTPVQHPANDVNSPIITTHFEYHAIDHNLLKLDILGHQDPTMIRMLQDLTGIDPVKDIPLDSKEVMSLFQDTSALGIKPADIGGCKLGALGIPEFGTDFAMQMVIDAKPQGFTDLVRISGLSHGTDVWLGNAQTLIEEGKATIRTAICTRDDIMIYLIEMGLDPSEAFTIMENIRKGNVAKHKVDDKWAVWKEHMKEHDVPDWYIESAEKIKYMFPKAHAAAYVMMAWRIAYCKIFYPLAYYASYFSIRASGFSYELMCMGRDKLEYNLKDYKARKDILTNKEQDSLRDMRIVEEMYARGFEFVPIDIYKAKANDFTITDDGRIMPALSSIDGLGETAAAAIENAAKGGEFLSKDDFMSRAGVGKSTAELLSKLGLLGDIPESNQISIFDVM